MVIRAFFVSVAAALCPVAFNRAASGATPMGTAFTYQGQLKQDGSAVSDTCDCAFSLWDDPAGGAQVGPTLTFDGQGGNPPPIDVSNGLFNVELDFGTGVFNGDARWLDIAVACPSRGAPTPLSPRQPITAAPYALQTRGVFVNDLNNVGIGTTTPDRTLHVHKGSAGSASGHTNAPLVVENSTSAYINLLSPDANERGILFGDPSFNADGGVMYNSSDTPDGLQFRVNGNITKMILGANGNVGIGTIAPTKALDLFKPLGEPEVGIGTSTPAEKLDVVGNIQATGNVCAANIACPSDARFKANVRPLSGALEKVEKLKPVSYDWKREAFPDHHFGKDRQVGLIAQEVKEILPEIVHEGSDGHLSVDYGRLTPLLIEAAKELNHTVNRKDAEMAALRAEKDRQIAALTARLERIEKVLARFGHDPQPEKLGTADPAPLGFAVTSERR